jgi:nucleotide-binding universal stress UspA family protein
VVEHVPHSFKTNELVISCAEELDKLVAADMRKTCKIKTAVQVGKPYEQIVQYAMEEQTDMVTMAVRGAEALDRAVFGSTTYRVIQLGPCPILAVHT